MNNQKLKDMIVNRHAVTIKLVERRDGYSRTLKFEPKKLSIIDTPYGYPGAKPTFSSTYDPRTITKEEWSSRTFMPYKRFSYNKDYEKIRDLLMGLDESEGEEDEYYCTDYFISTFHGNGLLGHFNCRYDNLDIYCKIEEIMRPYIPEFDHPTPVEKRPVQKGLTSITYTPSWSYFCSKENRHHWKITLNARGVAYVHEYQGASKIRPNVIFTYKPEQEEKYEQTISQIESLVRKLDPKEKTNLMICDLVSGTLNIAMDGKTIEYETIYAGSNQETIDKIIDIIETFIPDEAKNLPDNNEEGLY